MTPRLRTFSVLALFLGLSSPALALDVVAREVTFTHGAVRLSGTLFSPTAPGTYPAMVLLPGSGSETRDTLLGLAQDFAAEGMVTLAYDKQGTGKSGGDWTTESVDDLAGDALAAIQLLHGTPGVGAHAIGAWGISQAGWVLPRLALQYPDLPFIICVTGGGTTPREVEYYGYHNEMLHSGFSEADWDAARPLVDQYMQYLATGQDRDALLQAIQAAKDQKWSGVLNLSRVLPDAADRAKWAWVASYDPTADIQALHMPVLVLIGGRDPFSPSGHVLQLWHEDLAKAGNPDDKVISYPIAGHGIRTNGHDMTTAAVYAPGFLQDQFSWLRTVGVLH
jgi:dienelactone hydrolase